MELCSNPVQASCSESFLRSYAFITKVKVLYSIPLEYLGTAMVGGMLEESHNFTRAIYNRVAGMDLNLSPENLVKILSTKTEMELVNDNAWSPIGLYDQSTKYCPGESFKFENFACVNNANGTVENCCCDYRLCEIGTFESVLQVMKDSQSPAHIFHFTEVFSNFSGDLTDLRTIPSFVNRDVLGLPILFEKKLPTVEDSKRFLNLEPFIPLCKLTNLDTNKQPRWGTKKEQRIYNYSFCTLFRPTFTDQGICYAFNGPEPNVMLKSSEHSKAFDKVFGKETGIPKGFQPFKITGMGKSNGLLLYLDAHTLTSPYKFGNNKINDFYLTFDNPDSFPLISNGGVHVSAGKKTSIVITPSVLESTEAVKQLMPTERGCQFPHESENSKIFSVYSHSGCIFECLWQQAADNCKCYPWKYPMPGNISEMCDLLGNICFKNILSQHTRVLNCSCKPDCSQVNYDYFIVQEDLNPTAECNKVEENKPLLEYLKNYQTDQHMTKFWNLLNTAIGKTAGEKVESEERMNCNNRITNDIAIVEIYFSTAFVSKMKKDVRTTFSDKISNIGKNSQLI